MNLRYELQNIISGIGKNSKRNLIEAAAHYLGKGTEASGNAKATEFTKDQETAKLNERLARTFLPNCVFLYNLSIQPSSVKTNFRL
jgi:coproporphyrinogen III oxidase-like Fe-S oxidoreductase